MTQQNSGTIAIVGRPNVGKSTLFNRLIGARKAVVSSNEGTTRDRLYGQAQWRGVSFTLIDAGGFELTKGDALAQAIQHHLRQALAEADALLFVCDAQDGLLPADLMIMDHLRATDKPIVLAVNKLDERITAPVEFFSLGLNAVLPISALHGRGMGELLDQLIQHLLPAQVPADVTQQTIAVAIVGRQNVGKSSLLNTFLREERAIVHSAPGTTRDAVDTLLIVDGQPFRLIDTAGLRHRRKVKSPVDLFSMVRTTEAIARCDVALVVLDATQGVTRDDQRIVTKVCEAGCGLILLVNKWDLMRGASERQLRHVLSKQELSSIAWAPILTTSATTGFHVQQSLALVKQVAQAMQAGLSADVLNATLQKAWRVHPPPRYRGRTIRLKHAHWIAGRPVRVELETQPVAKLARSYQHYLLKTLHASRSLVGVPIQVLARVPERFQAKRR